MEHYVEDANGFGGEEEEFSVLSGGTVYIESMSGPLANVGLFQSSILQELQGLELELASGSSQLIQRGCSRAKEYGSLRVQRLCSVIYETNMD
ncbi:hypothetical protein RchiOBHm_Chr2g0108841 [Rosa chinensis]|uniref:Uncharacterized protein n=2 Tax=Rosa chinensis TaxID=74649 RepID=A0A2P6RPC9_ROSCH|nr:hypothetical protein RchiOBHm_Chr2g0108841 [Rosa chinensis]